MTLPHLRVLGKHGIHENYARLIVNFLLSLESEITSKSELKQVCFVTFPIKTSLKVVTISYWEIMQGNKLQQLH